MLRPTAPCERVLTPRARPRGTHSSLVSTLLPPYKRTSGSFSSQTQICTANGIFKISLFFLHICGKQTLCTV